MTSGSRRTWRVKYEQSLEDQQQQRVRPEVAFKTIQECKTCVRKMIALQRHQRPKPAKRVNREAIETNNEGCMV